MSIKNTLSGALLLSVLILSACGFSPMYGKNASMNDLSIKANLDQISIDVIPNHEGQFLRNLLIDRFYINGYPTSPKYNLSVATLAEKIKNFDVTVNDEATRRQLEISTIMRLIDARTNAVIMTRPLYSITSYNVLESEYSTVVTEQSAREAALGDLARQIEQQIVLYLNR